MSSFVLTVIDADHLILTTDKQLDQRQFQEIQVQFDQWKNNGGAMIITDCVTKDRKAIDIQLGPIENDSLPPQNGTLIDRPVNTRHGCKCAFAVCGHCKVDHTGPGGSCTKCPSDVCPGWL